MFQGLPEPCTDAVVRAGRQFTADSRPENLNLGAGVYRDATVSA